MGYIVVPPWPCVSNTADFMTICIQSCLVFFGVLSLPWPKDGMLSAPGISCRELQREYFSINLFSCLQKSLRQGLHPCLLPICLILIRAGTHYSSLKSGSSISWSTSNNYLSNSNGSGKCQSRLYKLLKERWLSHACQRGWFCHAQFFMDVRHNFSHPGRYRSGWWSFLLRWC